MFFGRPKFVIEFVSRQSSSISEIFFICCQGMLWQKGIEVRVVYEGLNVGLEKGALGDPARDGEFGGWSVVEVKASHNFRMIRDALVK